jgi:hypothetical protein
MAWWWPFGARAVSDADAATLRRRCGTRVSALAACRAANADSKAACETFADDVALCQATVVCMAKADAFIKCSSKPTLAVTGVLPDCSKEAAAMRKCLRGYKLPA